MQLNLLKVQFDTLAQLEQKTEQDDIVSTSQNLQVVQFDTLAQLEGCTSMCLWFSCTAVLKNQTFQYSLCWAEPYSSSTLLQQFNKHDLILCVCLSTNCFTAVQTWHTKRIIWCAQFCETLILAVGVSICPFYNQLFELGIGKGGGDGVVWRRKGRGEGGSEGGSIDRTEEWH